MLQNQMESLSAANRDKMVVVTLDKASYAACMNVSKHCVSSRELREDCTTTPVHAILHDGVVHAFKKSSNPFAFFFKKSDPFFFIGYLRLYLVGIALSIPDVVLLVLDTDIVFDRNYDPFRFTEPYKLYEWNDMMAYCMMVNGSPLWRYPSSIQRGHHNPEWGKDMQMLNIGHWYLKGNDRTREAVREVIMRGSRTKFTVQDQAVMSRYLWLNTTSFTCFPDDHYLLEYVNGDFNEFANAAELEAMGRVDVLHVQGSPIKAKMQEMKRLGMWYLDGNIKNQ